MIGKTANATLVYAQAVSKAGNSYNYVSVQVDGIEIGRLFPSQLEARVIFA